MVDAIVSALRFAEGRTRSDMESDEMLLFALVRAVVTPSYAREERVAFGLD